jgi:uncharacterized membrane protein YfcA
MEKSHPPPQAAQFMLMTLVFVVLSAFCAALLRGFTGVGCAIAAVPLLSLGLPPQPPRAMIGMIGLVAGLMNGAAAVPGPPVVALLMALPNNAAVVRASSIVFFTFTACVAVVPLAIAGLIDRQTLLFALVAWPVLLLGTQLGGWGFQRAKPHHHRRVALSVLIVLATVLIVRSIGFG